MHCIFRDCCMAELNERLLKIDHKRHCLTILLPPWQQRNNFAVPAASDTQKKRVFEFRTRIVSKMAPYLHKPAVNAKRVNAFRPLLYFENPCNVVFPDITSRMSDLFAICLSLLPRAKSSAFSPSQHASTHFCVAAAFAFEALSSRDSPCSYHSRTYSVGQR